MRVSAAFPAVAVALPAFVLAGAGLTHPIRLTASTATWWMNLHVLLLPIFPLLAAAQWTMLDRAPAVLRVIGRSAASGFAIYYDGLDAVDGIAAGAVVHAHHGYAAGDTAIFTIGDRLGRWGAWCFLLASAVIVTTYAIRVWWAALPGAVVLLTAAVSFLDSHIFWPRGVFTMIGIGTGLALLTLADAHRSAHQDASLPTNVRVSYGA